MIQGFIELSNVENKLCKKEKKTSRTVFDLNKKHPLYDTNMNKFSKRRKKDERI